MLVVVHENKVLLEKRPDSGIWGGLFSLPELPATGSESTPVMVNRIVRPFGQPDSQQWLGGFIHTFTHFRLHITPLMITLSKRGKQMPDERYRWYDMAHVAKAPLPAPVRKILEGVKPLLKAQPAFVTKDCDA